MTAVPRISVRLPSPPVIGAGFGAAIACAMLLVPESLIEAAVLKSGIAAVVSAAEPPLGFTARVVLALGLGGLAGGVMWLAALILLGDEPRARPDKAEPERPIPVLRRADSHPDAPARAPLLAAQELGTPFLDVTAEPAKPAEQPLPADLDQPLAAYDPRALLPVPREPVRPVAPLIRPQLIDPGERFEVFSLAPPPPANDAVPLPPRPVPERSTEATIEALLARLERGVHQRAIGALEPAPLPPPPAPAGPERPASLSGALEELRRLATER